ncbi:hypothetical protein GcC1_225019 [Golovinomyces cichoracearum]|uniref:Uncharacterized protein n=1 Tax=Golovinomyces cichoracearum TaxID=62708 RepID=A0A420H258_9PEZI|nr:hypothetical protein GcC1_225019 [Golovinomyces cichoracearum]
MAKLSVRVAPLIRARNEQHNSSTMINLLISLLALVFVSLFLTVALYFVRNVRRRNSISRQYLHTYETNNHRNHRHLSNKSPYACSKNYSIYDEKILPTSQNSPLSPDSVPEIRITFPDEQDESGRRMSGRVVVVRVGESGIGLEPLRDEDQLPAYEEKGDRFHSIDMDTIGGLKEK